MTPRMRKRQGGLVEVSACHHWPGSDTSRPDRSIRAGPGPGPFQSRSRGLLLAGRQSRHSPAPSARTPLGRAQNAASRRLRASRQAETNGSRGQGRHGSQHKPRISRMLMNGRYATITRPGEIAANIPGDAPRCSIQTRHPLVGCLRGRSCLRPRRSPSSGAAATAKSPIRQTTPIRRISLIKRRAAQTTVRDG